MNMTRPINILDDYTLIYEITCLPTIIYAQSTKASEPFEFKDNIDIPSYLSTSSIECRFSIYHRNGDLIELSSEMLPSSGFTIKNTMNITPLKMINKLVEQLLRNIN